ncbi:MAG TPA: GNAT family N-acetyltransferase [Anaerolineae bacterium]|nr:GNAT family N-acetyltransferase [Anaerolineae bacterium]
MRKLIPMTQPEFDAFLERIIPDYAADNVRAGYWSEDEALEKSRKQTGSLLPQGLQTKNHYLYTLYDGDEAVGMIWMRAELDRPVKSGFIFDVEVKDEYRGKGYGKHAMLLIEEKARELGITRMGLHVFAYNDVAKNLYERIGYKMSSMNMLKDLE